jgi:hypothetical protein
VFVELVDLRPPRFRVLEHASQALLECPRAETEDCSDELLDRRGEDRQEEEDERQTDGKIERRQSGEIKHWDSPDRLKRPYH